jgi:hypothetical protein
MVADMQPNLHQRRRTAEQVAKMLRAQIGQPVNAAVGLPKARDNQDSVSPDGVYHEDGTSDPGIQHGVTGTGNGPIIGRG